MSEEITDAARESVTRAEISGAIEDIARALEASAGMPKDRVGCTLELDREIWADPEVLRSVAARVRELA